VFFVWQVVASILATSLLVATLWRSVPFSVRPVQFQFEYLRSSARFAAMVSANAVVGLALTQTDKVMLSALVPLKEFAYYTLAATAASVLWALIMPVNNAFYPRFVAAHISNRPNELSDLYHVGCQLNTAIVAPTAAILAFFSVGAVSLWTRDAATAAHVSPILVPLLIGTTINGVTSVASHLQSAIGWPGLVLKTNVVLAAILVPAIIAIVPSYGAVGAAWMWVLINSAYLCFTVPLMHTRVLRGQYFRWLVNDLAVPAAAVVTVGYFARLGFPETLGWQLQVGYAAVSWVLCTVTAILLAPAMRARVTGYIGIGAMSRTGRAIRRVGK
jgi:O-antigen/teichoic acid export membrane protein